MRHQKSRQKRPLRFVIAGAAIVVLAAGVVAAVRHYKPAPAAGPLPVHLPHAPESYVGVYSPEAPDSYAGVTAFKTATGVTPDVAMYYSGWFQGF
ncbi:MAG TPA: hypothetical protein VF256_05245, partial [Streptosporangiaceae bacterium]